MSSEYIDDKMLVIDENTNIKNIINKEKYERLVIKCRVNPNKLKEFINIKELTIDYEDKKEINYLENNLHKFVFSDNLEKLVFKKIENFGIEKKGLRGNNYYSFDLPSLKCIQFPMYMNFINGSYLEDSPNLEEIIFNDDGDNIINLPEDINIYSDNFKKIIIKINGKIYEIIPDYKISTINNFVKHHNNSILSFEFYDFPISTKIKLNYNDDIIEKTNSFNITAEDEIIFIPNNINKLYNYENYSVKKISFNMNLLKCVNKHDCIIRYLDKLETIEIRSNNKMSLIPSKEINVKEHGKLNKLYIRDYLMYLEYEECTITINSEGIIEKKEKEKSTGLNDLDLTKYSIEELETYMCYLKLLKISNNPEYRNAMKVVEKTLVKKLIKK